VAFQEEDPKPVLILTLLNDTFQQRAITVPFHPSTKHIKRQSTKHNLHASLHNGVFGTKAVSRNHAKIYADKWGTIFIYDTRSTNGTYVNETRLSPEGQRSKPRQLYTGDVVQFGVDVLAQDGLTVGYPKISAKVAHAGFLGKVTLGTG